MKREDLGSSPSTSGKTHEKTSVIQTRRKQSNGSSLSSNAWSMIGEPKDDCPTGLLRLLHPLAYQSMPDQ